MEDKANKNREYWQGVITDFYKSGLTIAKYSEEHNLPAYQVGYWKRKFDYKKDNSFQGFIEVESQGSSQSINAPKENNDVIIEVKISDICISIKSRDTNSLFLKAIKAALKL